MEPNLNSAVKCALYAPSAAIIAPWELAIAQAECAVEGGLKVELDCLVKEIKKEGGAFSVLTSKGDFKGRFVVNAAGVEADTISRMVETPDWSITPKSGEYFILDTTEEGLVRHVVFPCPSKEGKGVLVAPTVHGNIIVGPDSKACARGDYSTTAAGLDFVRQNAQRTVKGINFRSSIRNYSGLRADAGRTDFIVGESKETPGFFNIAGIKSPGLTSAPAIARDVAAALLEKGLDKSANPNFVAKRKVPRFKLLSEAEKKAAIKQKPLNGSIVCRCETITEGEIIDALKRPLPPRSLDALKRRRAAGMGRCQGGFCGPRVLSLIAKHFGQKPEDIPKDREGMFIITGETKS
jgi:glycerol-3-phosphate dehydrogenase